VLLLQKLLIIFFSQLVALFALFFLVSTKFEGKKIPFAMLIVNSGLQHKNKIGAD